MKPIEARYKDDEGEVKKKKKMYDPSGTKTYFAMMKKTSTAKKKAF